MRRGQHWALMFAALLIGNAALRAADAPVWTTFVLGLLLGFGWPIPKRPQP